ncbi:MAG: gamma-glutamylcyclotransferase family protein [Vicinamibacterales bacterium]
MPRLFAYGTLLDGHVQRAVFGRALTGVPDALPGHVLSMLTVEDPRAPAGSARYPNVTPTGEPADAVPGTVYDLTGADLLAADLYETSMYRRQELALASGATAWVYVSARGRTPGPDGPSERAVADAR